MKIGIDLTPLQGPHRMRGVGSVLINFINNLPDQAKRSHSFTFFQYENEMGNEDPIELLNLYDVNYEIRLITTEKEEHQTLRKKIIKVIKLVLPVKVVAFGSYFTKAIKAILYVAKIKRGDTRNLNLESLDYFIQFDQNQPLPRTKKVNTVLVLYDLIPYVLDTKYLKSYTECRNQGYPRREAAVRQLERFKYIKRNRIISRQASILIAISENTKNDFIRHARVKANRIHVCLLGVGSNNPAQATDGKPIIRKLVSSGWGYLPEKIDITEKPYLLYVGGIDPRRELKELVAAFNNLRARGRDIRLVFAGDTLKGAKDLPNEELSTYLTNSSYIDDVIFLGFIDDMQRNYLYKNAVAYVYPSIYEGFGLPILEAMRAGTPVITYNNSSIKEVAGNAAIFVNGYKEIASQVEQILDSKVDKSKLIEKGTTQANKFSWEKTTQSFLEILETN